MKIDQEIAHLKAKLAELEAKQVAYKNDPMLELIDKVQQVRYLADVSHRQLIDIILLHDLKRTSAISNLRQDCQVPQRPSSCDSTREAV